MENNNKLPSLFTIQNELKFLEEEMNLALQEQRELPMELEEKMSELLFQESEKIASCCVYFDNVEKEIEFAKEQREKIDIYIKGLNKKRDYLLEVAKKSMLTRGLKSLDGDMGRKISLRRSEQVVVEIDPIVLPAEFVKHKIEADKTAIKDALKKGIAIEGCFIKENQNINWK